jgi:tripartite-type tricarboxylate transporter receptor subunit TctC
MKRKFLALLLVSFFVSTLISASELRAAPYYEGKVIKIVVAFPPGGGYDRMARILAKYLPRYIPGKPTVIVENMPGASGMIGANHVYNIAKPDGLTIGAINRVTSSAQLLKVEGVKFDMLKFSWIGSMAVETSVFAIRSDLPYKTFDDLKKAKDPINIGATGPGDTTYNFPTLVNQFLGLNLKLTTGYVATADILLATERKEVDGYASAYNSIKPHIARGLLRPLLRTKISSPGIENLPAVEDLTTDRMGKTILSMYSVSDRIGRPYVTPPGTSAETMNILRDGFSKLPNDPELKQEADKLMMDVGYTPSGECLKQIQFLLSQPPETVSEFKKYIKF